MCLNPSRPHLLWKIKSRSLELLWSIMKGSTDIPDQGFEIFGLGPLLHLLNMSKFLESFLGAQAGERGAWLE